MLSPRTPCSRSVVDAAARIARRTVGSGASLSRRRVRGALTWSRSRIVGGEVVREPFANTLGGQTVVGQVIVVCAARAGPVARRPTARPSSQAGLGERSSPRTRSWLCRVSTGSVCKSANETSANRSSPTRLRKSIARRTASTQLSTCSAPSSLASLRSLLQLRTYWIRLHTEPITLAGSR